MEIKGFLCYALESGFEKIQKNGGFYDAYLFFHARLY